MVCSRAAGSLSTGISISADVTSIQNVRHSLHAIRGIAFAYPFSKKHVAV
jgi:hypothetical protein